MKIGFIGCGSMGSAMIYGLSKGGYADLYAYDLNEAKVDYLVEKCNINKMVHYREIADLDILFLAVEPGVFKTLAPKIKQYIESQIIISIAAGISIEKLTKLFSSEQKFVRAMPNAPALIGEGITSLVYFNLIEKEVGMIRDLFSCFGKYVELGEKYFDAFTSICGSSPAFVFMFIEALANAGVLQGIPKELAYDMVAQSVMGSAKMLLDNGEHPAKLKDAVCSPSGATIEGVVELEKYNFRYAVIQAAVKTGDKSRKMSKSN